MTGTLDVVLQLAAQGFSCFPCREDKTPACSHGFKDAARDAASLHDLWRRYPGPLIGVAAGEVSGLDVLDLDKKHSQAVEWWMTNQHCLPQTRVHRTRSGGLHVLFRHAPRLRCWTARPVAGVDGRADGGYIIWWPAAGLPVLCDAQPTPWPEWLLDELTAARADGASQVSWRRPPVTLTHDRAKRRYAEAALMNAVERVSRAGEGARNSTLNAEAHGLGRLVAAGLIDGQRVADALAAAAVDAGLTPREIVATLQSAFRARGIA